MFIYQYPFAHFLSRITRFFATLYLPTFLRSFVLGLFGSIFKINGDEAEFPLSHYHSFQAYFTRSLAPRFRPIVTDAQAIVCPSDGVVQEWGRYDEHSLLQAKGISYSCRDFIPEELWATFASGSFLTIYLAPKDCHRIFSPCTGQVTRSILSPGDLYPVREPHISGTPQLYGRNEWISTIIQTASGPIAVVKVGAFNVGSITVQYDACIRTNERAHQPILRDYEPAPQLSNGEWLGTFQLGSTVILIVPSATGHLDLEGYSTLHYGIRIGTRC